MIFMHIKEIWPEPPMARKNADPPKIPKNIEAFQRTFSNISPEKTTRTLSEILSEISSVFVASVCSSTCPKKSRDINAEVEKIGKLYEEVNAIIGSLREIEGRERLVELVKRQISKKKNLIRKLNLKEARKSDRLFEGWESQK
ncbi:uncharacterized protein NEMAJ01_0230 [Nematocida major]|uniref:uncharacterized protein n=1 Tax=Nematocida major TaxID=1912982 RepID=UPI0020088EBD|nr:uncharacterized protein NEMAJ01_0230 [Nematocida major]KAH9385334.1 hypothetical protein NEMAJ01_0230 [Nematocida major]